MRGAVSAALLHSRPTEFATLTLLGIGALGVAPSPASLLCLGLLKHRSLALEEGVQCSVATACR